MNSSGGTKHAFQADVARLLHMMVHSVYSERSIFLRELISNAADACEKLRFQSIESPALLGGEEEFTIRIRPDKAAGTLEIADNGVGMSQAELVQALGTIAHSGTRNFLESNIATSTRPSDDSEAESPAEASRLIGQFGVGFYSAFIVADKVVVTSVRAGTTDASQWTSEGAGTFTIESVKAPSNMARGTRVLLYIKPDSREFLERNRLEEIVREHSAAIQIPIELAKESDETFERVTDGTAIWSRPKSAVTKEQYTEFYRELARQIDEPALTVHWHAEGRYEYSVLGFIPGSRPFDLFDPARKGSARLYVRRVLITEDADILPAWLRFARLVVDAADVPLNISRELVQKSPVLAAIRKAVTNRLLQEIANLANTNNNSFDRLWKDFGPVLKEGLYEEPERRDQIFSFARFATTTAMTQLRTLKNYVDSMKENQTAIYFIVGESPEHALASPQLEGFRARGIEVLLLTDPVDSFWTTTALGFDGKPFKAVTQGAIDLSNIPLSDDSPKAESADEADLATFLAYAKSLFGDAVGDVRVTGKLAESPACLVTPETSMDRRLEKLLAEHGRLDEISKPIFEINPSHDLIKDLVKQVHSGGNRQPLEDGLWMLLDEARMIEGERPADAVAFRQRLFRVIGRALH